MSTLSQLAVSFVVAACLTAALIVARIEWKSLRAEGKLTCVILEDMRLSLATLPTTIVAMLIGAATWALAFVAVAQASPYVLTGSPVLLALAALIAADFSYYLEHRCAHRSMLLWRLYHAVHHTSKHYNVAVAYRVSFLHQLVAPLFYLPWVASGFEPLLIMASHLIVLHYQGWVHTEHIGRLRFLDGWLNTPANHRMHHSAKLTTSPKNFGGILIIWDRLFGTYIRPSKVNDYGIAGVTAPTSLWGLYTAPFRRLTDQS